MNHMDLELYNGVISGNNEVLKEIEGRPTVVDQVTPTNYTVLHLASQYGNTTCVEQILRAHPSLLLKLNSRGETPLHLAARGGHVDVAKALINAAKSSALQLNDPQIRSTVVEFLIRTANVEFDTALHEAARYNRLNVVKLLVAEDPSDSHHPNKNDETPLYMACLRGYEDIVKAILAICVSPTYGGPCGRTALHAAILDKNFGSVKPLVEKMNKLIEVSDDYGWTSFHYAAYNNCPLIMEYLIHANKSVAYQPDKSFKRSALHIAAHLGHVGVAEKLLKYCPDSCDTIDGNGRNILHIAVERNDKEFIKYVLKNCKEINNLLLQKDKHGNTPLHLMTMLGCYVPEVFNHKQLDLEALNAQNLTPLDVIYSDDKILLNDQKKLSAKLLHGNAKRTEYLGHLMKEQEFETGKIQSNYYDAFRETVVHYDKLRDTHMIVAALIATVALTAGFAMPGGFDGNAGPNQGSPALLRKAAFKTFVLTDTIALLCSLSSLFIYFMSVFFPHARHAENIGVAAFFLNIFSIVSIVLAFITGTYAVLVHSLALAISVIIISSFFFILVYFLVKKFYD